MYTYKKKCNGQLTKIISNFTGKLLCDNPLYIVYYKTRHTL